MSAGATFRVLGFGVILCLVLSWPAPDRAGPCPDSDGDGICDEEDNCVDIPNPHQGPPRKLNGSLELLRADTIGVSFSPDSSTVVFLVEEAPDIVDVYSVKIDGGTPVKLSPDGGVVGSLISPDGTTVVYRHRHDPWRDIYSVPIGGGTVTNLTSLIVTTWFIDISISPDSSTVVFSGTVASGHAELFSVPIGGGEVTKLNVPLAPGRRVDWFELTSDGATVLYALHKSSYPTELYSVPIGGGPSVLLDGFVARTIYDSAKITPDGSTAVYIGDDGVSHRLLAVPVAGGTPTLLSDPLVAGGEIYSDFQLSPDGSTVVYRAFQDSLDLLELYSVPITGGGTTKLNAPLVFGGWVSEFAVSADGTIVAYVADHEVDGRDELYSVPIGGGSVTKLNGPLVGSRSVERVTVSPSSPYVVYGAYQADRLEWDLYSVPIGGGPYTLIADEYKGPRFSPDGAFVVSLNEAIDVFRVNITGGAVITLNLRQTDEQTCGGTRISPDSLNVLFTFGTLGIAGQFDHDLFVSDVDPAGADVDGDGFGGACDCDDSNAHCSTDCTDDDSDDYCITDDCDDSNPFCGGDCTDADSDHYCAEFDCNDSDGLLWTPPSEVRDLVFEADKTTLSWLSPVNPGGSLLRLTYDTVRSPAPFDFIVNPITCVEVDDGPDRESEDPATPAEGETFYYLIRPRNGCGEGPIGSDSSGAPRLAGPCE